eukprot:GHVR01086550.1.p1 GENE.GHVR01086550.1~~GHVR01086550.1.p1  ORF type:complete len:130 (+),score=4.95 GHVR01086550.1:556-945(+)
MIPMSVCNVGNLSKPKRTMHIANTVSNIADIKGIKYVRFHKNRNAAVRMEAAVRAWIIYYRQFVHKLSKLIPKNSTIVANAKEVIALSAFRAVYKIIRTMSENQKNCNISSVNISINDLLFHSISISSN